MKKKRAQARKPSPRKIRPATAAPPHTPPPLPPEPRDPGDPGGDDTRSIAAMLRAQLEATHLAAMDCLHRARIAESPELRDRALTHATRLLSLFTRQVNVLERRRPPAAAAPRTESRAASGADTADQKPTHAAAKALADAAAAIPADDPACIATLAAGDGGTPAGYNSAGRGAGIGP